MPAQTYRKGDVVKVSFEGTVTRVLSLEDGNGNVELRIEVPSDSDSAHYVTTDTASVLVVEPAERVETFETFGPGDVVRGKHTGVLYAITADGFLTENTYCTQSWPFTSAHYERVTLT